MPKNKQIAALPLERTENGKIRVLMITSRDTGRWVIPKGWPMKNKSPAQAAAVEAIEEAGATGKIKSKPIGTYAYNKRLDDGEELPLKVDVFPLWVKDLASEWKEKDERTRKWFSPKKAAKKVDEPDLSKILKSLT
jgi:8-oxo-dGTP pyrophosphatase MutT (NUDIX family)